MNTCTHLHDIALSYRPSGAYSPECVERLYEKASKVGQPPHHEATHGSIYERFAACT
jgi:hypothetical protein